MRAAAAATLCIISGFVELAGVLTLLQGATVRAPGANLAALLAVEHAWDEANLHHDVAALRKILSPPFVQITETGEVIARDSALRLLASHSPTGRAYDISRRKVIIRGDFASLSATYAEVGLGKHGPYKVIYRIADVYQYDNGWKGIVGYGHLTAIVHCKTACALRHTDLHQPARK